MDSLGKFLLEPGGVQKEKYVQESLSFRPKTEFFLIHNISVSDANGRAT